MKEKLNTTIKKPSGKLSNLSETLIGSEIVKLGADIKEKIKSGETIYNFTIGDFDSSIFFFFFKLEEEIVNVFYYFFLIFFLSD